MREIKFRVWDNENDQMIYEVGITQTGEAYKFGDGLGADQLSVDSADYWPDGTLMQYTGLVDMDGTEIYEGDFVKIFNTITGSVASPKRITWNGETARFNGLSLGTSRVMKVIGNIYENAELLK